jgi:hypothetical protein
MKDLRKLHNLLIKSFNMSELHDLCFTLNVDFDELPDAGKEGKIRELLQYLNRHGRLEELVQLCAQQRPSLSWEDDAVPAQARQPAPPVPPGGSSLTIEDAKTSISFELECDRSAYLRFMQAAFSLEQLLQFIRENDHFTQLAYSLPRDASHSGVTRQLFEYARRRKLLGALLEALAQHDPALYEQHGPMIEAAQVRINVVFDVKGDDARLRTLQARPPGEQARRRIEQVIQEALLQADRGS